MSIRAVVPAEVALRAVAPADLAIFFEHQADPEASAMAGFPSKPRDEFIAHWRAKVLGDSRARAKTILVGTRVAGSILSWVSAEGDKRLIGYWIGREYWGRGVATEAVRQFLQIEVTQPLHAFALTSNTASVRVLENCGFRPVGDPITGADGLDDYLFALVA
jgi:RimJ/RimL family protein N-acetyltransferase